ncbi:MAG: hypothetical protein PHV45_07640 [Desulfuromonas thiophila]|jgi:hypothetical protein|nr:hypothetical protein [Desulfuromonas thiophila]
MRTGRYGNVQRGRIGVALVCLLLLMTALAGCSRLLPRSQEVTRSKWHSFEQIKAAYDQIVPGSSLADLAAMGFDLEKTPNLQLLNATELAVLFQSTPPEALPPELQGCLNQPDACRACVYDLQRLHSRRVGNFWADFFQLSPQNIGLRLAFQDAAGIASRSGGLPAVEWHGGYRYLSRRT